ncbi:ImmA/IrrE family metallo-endopeptidase [Salinispora tropica]|uniref:IrrE N-terminal-like domain-containing protein n=1 Tax=Salinispora tropica (strain ATCC BAA-916 / DSM 44818 / JCM 13857 / NBRC 105044 / CNB-440) TaxID=369723 RepID=A4XCG9_SALTO|nr:ImmA/IrrE family metallo-endopeptidase [Salinispora tropica]ABP56626.1 hypothetical protein Strop_4198 [Salinispora tropica CNB-440]
MTLRHLRKRCKRVVAALDMPETFDLPELCRLLGERRGRPIHLVPISLPVHSVCGMWVPTDTFDAIFYEQHTSPIHQMLIIGHELGHLLAGHRPAAVLDPDASKLLLPDLDPQTVQRFLGRSNYAAEEEREAEMIGSLLLRRLRDSSGSGQDTPGDGPEAALYDRLRQSLEHPGR